MIYFMIPGLPFPYSQAVIDDMSVKLPPEFDWRLFGAVTQVKGIEIQFI